MKSRSLPVAAATAGPCAQKPGTPGTPPHIIQPGEACRCPHALNPPVCLRSWRAVSLYCSRNLEAKIFVDQSATHFEIPTHATSPQDPHPREAITSRRNGLESRPSLSEGNADGCCWCLLNKERLCCHHSFLPRYLAWQAPALPSKPAAGLVRPGSSSSIHSRPPPLRGQRQR